MAIILHAKDEDIPLMLEDCASIHAAENSGTTLSNHQSSCEKISRNMANDSSIFKETDNESVKVVVPLPFQSYIVPL